MNEESEKVMAVANYYTLGCSPVCVLIFSKLFLDQNVMFESQMLNLQFLVCLIPINTNHLFKQKIGIQFINKEYFVARDKLLTLSYQCSLITWYLETLNLYRKIEKQLDVSNLCCRGFSYSKYKETLFSLFKTSRFMFLKLLECIIITT